MTVTDSSLLQFWKTCEGMDATASGIVTEVMAVPMNAFTPMLARASGMFTSSREEQPLKVFWGMFVMESGTRTLRREVQFWKALLFIFVTLSGIYSSSREEHPQKRFAEIVEKASFRGILNCLSAVQFWNR